MSNLGKILEFMEDCEPYFHPVENVMTLTNPPVLTDNNFLFTATCFFIAERFMKLPSNYIIQPLARRKSLFLETLKKRRIRPGLFNPYLSWDRDQNLSHDEILGLAAFSEEIACELMDYAMPRAWVFNNLGTLGAVPAQWMGRFPSLIAFLKSRGHVARILPLAETLTIAEFLLADRKKDPGQTSGACRRFIIADHFATHDHGPVGAAARSYLRFLTDRYGDVSGLYSIYFNQPNHPFAKHTNGMSFLPPGISTGTITLEGGAAK